MHTHIRYLAAAATVLGLGGIAHAGAAAMDAMRLSPNVGASTRAWIPNAGQWDEAVAFRAETVDGSAWLTRDGAIVHQLAQRTGGAPRKFPVTARDRLAPMPDGLTQQSWVVTERIVSAKISAPAGVRQTSERVGFNNGRTTAGNSTLPTWSTVTMGEVRPGIRLDLRAGPSGVEKIFTLEPGTDPADLRIVVDGAGRMQVAEDGGIDLSIPSGAARLSTPIAFQRIGAEQRPVEVRYAIDADARHYRFCVGDYDRTRPLVIDPFIRSTFVGGSADEYVRAVAIHPQSGDVYVVGSTSSNNFPGTMGGARPALAGLQDVAISRFSADLTQRLQSTYFGGSSHDTPGGIAIHPGSGDVYITGSTGSIDLPNTMGSAQAAATVNGDAFVARFDASLGTLRKATYLGGSGGERAGAIAIHPASGEIYIAGSTNSTNLPNATNGAQAPPVSIGPGEFAFVSRLDAALSQVVQSSYAGIQSGCSVMPTSMIVHRGNGDIYFAAHVNCASPPSTVGYPGSATGAQPLFATLAGTGSAIVRMTPALTQIVRSTFFTSGQARGTYVYGIAAHPLTGDIYLVGSSSASDLPAAINAAAGQNDTVVSQLDASLRWYVRTAYFGSSSQDYGHAIDIHPVVGDIFIGGSTNTNFTVPGLAQPSNAGGEDAVIHRLDASLGLLSFTYLGGTASDAILSIAVHPINGDVYAAGQTSSSTLPAIDSGAQPANGGPFPYSDGFISKLTSDLLSADFTPNAFTFPSQIGVPLNSLRTSPPVQVTGLGAAASVFVSGPVGSSFCISSTATCVCDATPGGTFTSARANIDNNQYLCARHVSSPYANEVTTTRIAVGSYATRFQSHTGGCNLDVDGNGSLDALSDGLMLLRAMFGLTGTSVTANAAALGASRTTWAQIQPYLNGNCGTSFLP